jgi:hypothetical protein
MHLPVRFGCSPPLATPTIFDVANGGWNLTWHKRVMGLFYDYQLSPWGAPGALNRDADGSLLASTNVARLKLSRAPPCCGLSFASVPT